jgi:hypothetical protein
MGPGPSWNDGAPILCPKCSLVFPCSSFPTRKRHFSKVLLPNTFSHNRTFPHLTYFYLPKINRQPLVHLFFQISLYFYRCSYRFQVTDMHFTSSSSSSNSNLLHRTFLRNISSLIVTPHAFKVWFNMSM